MLQQDSDLSCVSTNQLKKGDSKPHQRVSSSPVGAMQSGHSDQSPSARHPARFSSATDGQDIILYLIERADVLASQRRKPGPRCLALVLGSFQPRGDI